MLDISQANTIIMEDFATRGTQATFLGIYDDEDEKHGYNLKTTIYGIKKPKYSALTPKGYLTITFIDETNKEIIRSFFKDQTKITISDQDTLNYTGLLILGQTLRFSKKYDDEGNKFYTANIEVG